MPIVPIKSASPAASAAHNRPDIVARVRVRRPIVAPRPIEPDAAPAISAAASPVSSITTDTAATDSDAVPYAVGYKRPPKHTQLPKGRSGNPKGRPSGSKSFKTIVRETLTAKIKIRTAKGRKNTTSVQALMMQTLESALKGSQRDRHELLRYYREVVPDEPETRCSEVAVVDATEPDDIDAHDRAILERLRAKIIDELGDDK